MNSTEEERSCVESLRSVKRALEERGAGLERASRMARLRWNRREQLLVAQVATLQNEAQLAAFTYQQRLKRYLLHISSIAEQIAGYCKSDSSTAADMQTHTSDHSTTGKLQKTVEERQMSSETLLVLQTEELRQKKVFRLIMQLDVASSSSVSHTAHSFSSVC